MRAAFVAGGRHFGASSRSESDGCRSRSSAASRTRGGSVESARARRAAAPHEPARCAARAARTRFAWSAFARRLARDRVARAPRAPRARAPSRSRRRRRAPPRSLPRPLRRRRRGAPVDRAQRKRFPAASTTRNAAPFRPADAISRCAQAARSASRRRAARRAGTRRGSTSAARLPRRPLDGRQPSPEHARRSRTSSEALPALDMHLVADRLARRRAAGTSGPRTSTPRSRSSSNARRATAEPRDVEVHRDRRRGRADAGGRRWKRPESSARRSQSAVGATCASSSRSSSESDGTSTALVERSGRPSTAVQGALVLGPARRSRRAPRRRRGGKGRRRRRLCAQNVPAARGAGSARERRELAVGDDLATAARGGAPRRSALERRQVVEVELDVAKSPPPRPSKNASEPLDENRRKIVTVLLLLAGIVVRRGRRVRSHSQGGGMGSRARRLVPEDAALRATARPRPTTRLRSGCRSASTAATIQSPR